MPGSPQAARFARSARALERVGRTAGIPQKTLVFRIAFCDRSGRRSRVVPGALKFRHPSREIPRAADPS
jgi:hypothetical protein